MKKYVIIFIIIGLISGFIGFFLYNRNKSVNNSGNDSYNSTRVSTNNSQDQANTNPEQNNNIPTENNTSSAQNSENNENTATNEIQEPAPETPKTETQISEFSTKIYTKDKKRQNNIEITCSSLNDTYVNSGDTFSFCDTVGKATTSKGYEKADVFKNGDVIKALGGGNCQVSTTLYNAVLEVDELKVTERHQHSNNVPYIKKGKDAAVSYGTYDFKFVNNTENTIKITASTDGDYVYIKLFKLE